MWSNLPVVARDDECDHCVVENRSDARWWLDVVNRLISEGIGGSGTSSPEFPSGELIAPALWSGRALRSASLMFRKLRKLLCSATARV